MLVGVVIVFVLGLVFTATAARGLLRDRRLRGNGVAARGVIVGQENRFGAGDGSVETDASLTQHPVVEFTARDGSVVRAVSPVGTNQSRFVPGRQVTVYCDPANPERCSIARQGTGVYRLFLAIGVGCLLGALIWLVVPNPDQLVDWMPLGIPLLLGGIFASIGWVGIRRTWRIKRGGSAQGVVVGASRSSTRHGITPHHPVVRYRGPAGHPVDAPSIRGHMRAPPPPGTRVVVNYDPADPHRMLLANDGTPPMFWLFAAVGVLTVTVGSVIVAGVLAG